MERRNRSSRSPVKLRISKTPTVTARPTCMKSGTAASRKGIHSCRRQPSKARSGRLGLCRVWIARRKDLICRLEQAPVSVSGMDFRFDPRTGDCEAITGNGQFGLTFDDFGRRFVCDNRHPIRHVVLEAKYLARNPYFAAPAVLQDVAKGGEESHVFPLTKAWTTSNLHAGQFTAACEVEFYRGGNLPASYDHQRVHLRADGELGTSRSPRSGWTDLSIETGRRGSRISCQPRPVEFDR